MKFVMHNLKNVNGFLKTIDWYIGLTLKGMSLRAEIRTDRPLLSKLGTCT